jgi:large subunit ribosomal protein L7/L12
VEDFTATITALGDQIANLKRNEAEALLGYLKARYGIEASAAKVEPTVIDDPDEIFLPDLRMSTVVLEGLADASKKIPVIKVVRELTNCPLAEGKAFVESAPRAITEKIPWQEAEIIKKKLEEAGARVSVK